MVAGDPTWPLARSVLAAATIGMAYFGLSRVADIGLGNVRLAAFLAFLAGWADWIVLVAFILIAHVAGFVQALRALSHSRRGRIALGPALVTGLYAATALEFLGR